MGDANEAVIAERRTAKPDTHTPGETGIWLFIFGDLIIFALFFAIFLFYRADQVELYNASQASLNNNYGALNTLFLLSSSWFVVLAMNAARASLRNWAFGLFSLALACGAGFSVVKIIEYSEKLAQGISITTNDFYMFYYILTGLHFIHVMIGMVFLIIVLLKLRQSRELSSQIGFFEISASYWHMVDILWVILFPLIYLIK
jgi:nitric oxide reductase NorE protein